MKKPIIVSACLAGIECRYDGKANRIEKIEALVRSGRAIPVCPEVLGGLEIPRTPCEIVESENGFRVLSKEGKDLTQNFRTGAEKTLAIARATEAETAILKSKSPSCGCGMIYDGTFSGTLIDGNGLTSDLLLKNGIQVLNEEDFDKEKK